MAPDVVTEYLRGRPAPSPRTSDGGAAPAATAVVAQAARSEARQTGRWLTSVAVHHEEQTQAGTAGYMRLIAEADRQRRREGSGTEGRRDIRGTNYNGP